MNNNINWEKISLYLRLIERSDSGVDSFEATYLKLFPESLFGFLRIVCYFVELSYPVLNVGCIYPRGVKGLN